ncbi:TPA: hypothetical protein N0F65_007488 [Lagenidium giganteum]|uniref:WRKY19-like zinc finger domain-containing protein n=1 Tax=Lagenidium giganteum TaxID=4803 RepID=A0AAV2ZHM7_9STRA|nr:TPA: hypothetical protein N0F65_007488 [Lagenidium giganteum]
MASPTTTIRLPSLFVHTTSNDSSKSPRLASMKDVLSLSIDTSASPRDSMRLPSIGAMIHREHDSPKAHTVMMPSISTMSPTGKQRSVDGDIRSHPEYALGSLLSQLASSMESTSPTSPESPEKSKRTNSAKLCGMDCCRKRAKAGGYCIAHGGGLRCSEEGCQKHAVSLGLCISHGGGKRCTIDGCLNASRKNGVCWSHGGKRLCKLEGCNKGPKSGGYCWSHGGKMKK